MTTPDDRTSRPELAPLDRHDAVFLPVDYMHGLISACTSIEPGTLRNNALALAKIARLFELPAVRTGDEQGRTYLGAEMPEVGEILPGAPFVPRSTVGAWEEPDYVAAVKATGRGSLIMAGISTEQCVAFTARSAIAAGYTVYVVVDCCASLDARTEQAAWLRLTQQGAILTSWSALGAELLGDFATPEGPGLIQIYAEHQTNLRTVSDNWDTAVRFAQSQSSVSGAATNGGS